MKYEAPEMYITKFSTESVVTDSGITPHADLLDDWMDGTDKRAVALEFNYFD